MTLLRLQQLKPGMVLGKDAITLTGELVLPRGTALTEKHIVTLQAWGIPEVEIAEGETASPEDADHSQIDPEVLAQAKAFVRGLFAKSNPEHPAIQELMRLALKKRLQQV